MAGKGWFKLHRKITESAIFTDPDLLRLWIYCLAKASHKDTTVMIEKQEVQLSPGQFITGRFSLHQEFNAGVAPRKKVKDTTLWNWLKKLETLGNVDIKSSNKYSVVTVIKWSDYQESLTTDSQQIDNRMTTDSQQIDTNKNVKNLENEKEIDTTDNFTRVERAYATIHKTMGLKPIDWPTVNQLLEKGVTADLIIEVMEEKHAKKIQEGVTVNGFSFYTNAINERFNQGQRNEGRLDFLNDL